MTKQTNQRRNTTPARPSTHSPQAPRTFEPVELRWILKSLAAVVALAVVCGYVTLCVVFSRNQWQLVLHPSREVAKTPESIQLPFTEVHFGPADTGPAPLYPQLDGWWIPGDLPSDRTVLLLHAGNGSMSDYLPIVRMVHDANLNVLIFDYRGYGRSAGNHPTEATMEADAESALSYLTTTRNIAPGSILVDGGGVGGSIAVRLCAEHPQLAALILHDPIGDLKSQIVRQADTLLPARLLFHQDFPLAEPLKTLPTPKLLLTSDQSAGQEKLHAAADPKMVVTFGATDPATQTAAIRGFLDTYLTHR